MPYPLPLTRTEAYLAYKAGVIQQSDLEPSLAVPRNGIDAWLAYWTGLTDAYPVKKVGKNLFSGDFSQFDNTGGVGSLYAYFKLPDDGVYTLTLIAKNDVTGTSGTFFGFTTTGGDGTNPRNWVFYQGLTMTKGNTRSVTNVNGGVNQHYVSLYLPSSDTFQWFIDNFEIQLEKGSTATAYEPYTGGPLILQEEEAYIAYLCGVINEYPEKSLRRVGAYLRYLISARWGRPDHPLNREELYLSLIKTQVIPSGDPSSDIVIDGTAKAPFQDVKMYGDTFQQTYTGKNLLSSVWEPGSYSTTTGGKQDVANTYRTAEKVAVQSDTTYIVSRDSEGLAMNYYEYDANGNFLAYTLKSANQSITTGQTTKFITMSRSQTGGFEKMMLESGSTVTAYEPYVGGQPSPSPEYPQPIQTVTGLQTVEVSGKNLFDGIFELGNINPTTGANTSSTTTIRTKNYAVIKGGENYTISIVGGGTVALGFYQSDGTFIGVGTTKASPNTFTAPANAGRVRFIIASNTNISTKAQCEKGSSPTDWTPYSKQTYEINLGENLFDYYGLPLSDKFLNGNGVMETGNTHYKNQEIAVTGGETFYWSSEAFGPSASTYLRLGQFNGNTFISRNLYRSNASITLDKNTTRVVLSVDYEPSLDRYFTNPMLAKGSTSTAYAPYFEPIELCKLGTYQDYIWKDGENWKVHKAISKYVFETASGTGAYWEASLHRVYFTVYYQNAHGITFAEYTDTTTQAPLLADKFKSLSFDDLYANGKSGIALSTTKALSIRNNSWTDETTARNEIVGTTMYYALATATDTVITNQALIDQLEALVAGGAENGTTYIKVNAVSPNLPGLLYVEAPKYE